MLQQLQHCLQRDCMKGIEDECRLTRRLEMKNLKRNQSRYNISCLPPEPFFEKKPQSKQEAKAIESAVTLTSVSGTWKVRLVLARNKL